jgi:6-phosphogluconolactonase (cycloisomerase 2 family)
VYLGVQRDGVGGADGLSLARDVAVSPDGAHVYVAGREDNEIGVFARNSATGALTFIEAENGGSISAMGAPIDVAVSPDGLHVYLATLADAVVVFSRNTGTGALTFVEAHDGGTIPGLDGANAVTVSPDGAHVYVASFVADAVVAFSRNGTTGALTYVETEQDGVGGVDGLDDAESVAVSPDGSHVYVGGVLDDAIAIFSRNGGTGALSFVGIVQDGVGGADGLSGVIGIALSPDGSHLYASGGGEAKVAVFSRNAGTGALSFVETETALNFPHRIAVSPDGAHVYVAHDITGNGFSVFTRNATTGELTLEEQFVDGVGGVDGLDGAFGVAVTPDNKHVYVTAGEDTLATFRKIDLTCSPSAQGGCFEPAVPGKAKLMLKDNALDAGDKLAWKWLHGAALTVGDFGDPVTTLNDYALCLYSSAGGAFLETELLAPAGGGCKKPSDGGALPCWQALPGMGFKYVRPDRHPDGVKPVKLLAGAVGASRVLVKAKGASVPLPGLPLPLPVTVQLQNADGACWTATYSTAAVNDGVTFRAVAD